MRRVLLGLISFGLAACPPAATPDAGAGAADAGIDAGVSDAGVPDAGGWVALFNGTDLSGWHSWMGKPSSNPQANEQVIGLDNDPYGVFSVGARDGEPTIHVTGQVFGALISEQEFGDFELELQYHWGTRTWPPLNFLDSGLMYVSVGPYGAVNAGGPALVDPIGTGGFLVSMEFQIAGSSTGTAPNLGPISFTTVSTAQGQERAGWNDVRVEVRDGGATHWLNGVKTAVISDFVLTMPGQAPVPLRRGRLQLQSEGGEIDFRRVRIRSPE